MCQHNLPCSIVYAHCLLPGRAFASLYVLLFLEKEAEIGGRVFMTYANHMDEDQPVHLRSLIGYIDIRCQDSNVQFASSMSTISTVCLLYVAGQTL